MALHQGNAKCRLPGALGRHPDQLCRLLDRLSGHLAHHCPDRPLILNRAKVLVAPASTAYKHSLKEVFSVPGIASQIKASAP